MVNERSLENLKIPKEKKEGYGYRYSIPQEKIDELFTYLAEGMSLKKAAKESKMCFETARKYFREGDAKRGIKPLQYRLTMFQEKISEKFNIVLEERRIKMLDITRTTITALEEGISSTECKCCDGQGYQVNISQIKEPCPGCNGKGKLMGDLLSKSNLNHLEKMVRLEVFLSGGVMSKSKETKILSAEDLSG